MLSRNRRCPVSSRKKKAINKAEKRRKRIEKKRSQDRRREQLKARRKLTGPSASATIPDGHSTPLMKHFSFDNPFFALTDDERRGLMKTVGTEAAARFQNDINELSSKVKHHDPVQLLATSAFYCLFKGVGPETDFT